MKKLLLSMIFISVLITQPIQAQAQDKLDIVIDGNFDDWENKPKTDIYFPWDTFNIKQGSLMRDAENIYFYLNMEPVRGTGGFRLMPSGYKLTIDNKTLDLDFIVDNIWGLGLNEKQPFDVGVWDADNSSYTRLPNAGYVRRSNPSEGFVTDIAEIKISKKDLGIDNTMFDSISISNGNLGEQTLTVIGGSTGFLKMGMGLVLVFGLYYLGWKQKTHFKLYQTMKRMIK